MLTRIVFFLLFAFLSAFAQQATNFTCTDMDGKSYTLYDILAEGKYVYIHQSGTF